MSLKAHGINAYKRLIEQNVCQARYLADLVETHPDLELLAPVSLNIVCFRFVPKDLPIESLNRINEEILLRVQESGLAVPSSTVIGDALALRIANTNHRSRRSDFELLIKAVVEIGHRIAHDS